MSCENYRVLIDDLLEDELDEQNAEQLNSHLPDCSSCSDYYKIAQKEKEIFGFYLSEVEPPADLWMKFQEKLNAEVPAISQTPETVAAAGWKTKFYGFFRLYPAIGFATVIIVLGIGWVKIASSENEYLAVNDSNNASSYSENNVSEPNQKRSEETHSPINSPILTKIDTKPAIVEKPKTNGAANLPGKTKEAKKSQKRISSDGKKATKIEPVLNEEQQQLIALEKEAARQIEKTEMLFRSFRNARSVNDGTVYDVEYEKRQARKLLEKNVEIRQIAERCGDLYTGEILDKAESVLLDIANLENNPSEEKVLSIKERLKNQNLIASLQVYR